MTRTRATLALLLGWAIVFGRLILRPDLVPYTRDLSRLYVPIRYFVHESLRHGRLPEWFPYESLGVPFIGQIVTATFHPQTWLFLAFTPLTALKLSILVAFLWGGAGAYRFARQLASRPAALTGASALMLSGYGFGVHNNPPYLWSFMTLPWIGWAALRVSAKARRRDTAVLAAVWALVFLGGDAQGFGLAGLLVATVLAAGSARQVVKQAAVAMFWALGLAAVELLPALTVFAGSFRLTVDAGDAPGRIWSMHPARLIELVLPGFVPRAQLGYVASHLLGGPYEALWSTSLFAGSVAIGLAVGGVSRANRLSRAFLVLGMAGLWLAFGARGGLWLIIAKVFPILRWFAYPEKYAALFFVALVPLTALGYDRLVSAPRAWRLFGAASLAAVVMAVLLTRFRADGGDLRLVEGAWFRGLLWSASACALAALIVKVSGKLPLIRVLLVALVFAELARAHWGYVPLVKRTVFESPSALAEAIHAMQKPGDPLPRVVPYEAPPPQAGEAAEPAIRRQVMSMEPELSTLQHIGALGIAMLPALPDRLLPIAGGGPMPWSRWLHACYRIQPADSAAAPMSHAEGMALIAEPCLPYAFAAGALSAATRDEAWQRTNGGLPPRSIVWEGGPVLAGSDAQPEVKEYSPGRVRIEMTAARDTALVISETTAAGWSATVDGRPAPIYPVNTVAQGVAVPRGQHTVEWRYRTPHLLAGALLSLLCWVAVLVSLRRTRITS